MTGEAKPPRGGRRPGRSGARGAILRSARAQFADRGYDRASIRAIARRAEVDPALVHHYFGTKERLFVEALRLPANPADVFPAILEGDLDGLGERIVRTFLEVWGRGSNRSAFVGILRSAFGNERAAAMLSEFLSRTILDQVARRLGLPDARFRASLAGSQLVGLAVLRFVLRTPPLAAADADSIVAAVAPVIQRYLTAPAAARNAPTARATAARATAPAAKAARGR